MTYTAERDEYSITKTLLQDYWQDSDGNVPKPTVLLAVTDAVRFDMNFEGNVVVIRMSPRGEDEQYRDQYAYRDVSADMILELWTKVSRQMLLDMKKEIRRIIHNKMHSPDVTQFQLIRYKNFTEDTQTNLNIWSGKITFSFEDNRILMDT